MKETLEKNKLIAEFMNYPQSGIDNKDPYYYAMKHCFDNNLMKYHSSWDWLMPVVEKIESLGLNTKIYTGHTTIASRDASFISQKLNDSKIEATYEAVVEFIKWFNTLSQGEKQL